MAQGCNSRGASGLGARKLTEGLLWVE